MPASSPPSRPSHAQGSPPVLRESWMRNYEAVDYEIPLLDAQGNADSGDEDVDEGVNKAEQVARGMRSQTDQPPPRTRSPPKNPSLSPEGPGNASADPRLPGPARMQSRTRDPSSQSTAASLYPPSIIPQQQQQRPPFQQQQQHQVSQPPPLAFDIKDGDGAVAVAEGQMGTGPSGLGPGTTGYVTNFSHQSSPSTTTVTAAAAGGPAFPTTSSSRSPRSPSFRSSPLAASVSSPGLGARIPGGAYPAQAPPSTSTSTSGSTSGVPPSKSNFSSGFATSTTTTNTSTASSAAMNTSSSMSNPRAMVPSSSSSTPPSSFSQSGIASSSGQNMPSMSSTPYSQYPLPNAASPPYVAKPGTRPSPASNINNININNNNNNNNNNSHMNPATAAYMHTQDSRPFVGAQGMDGGSGSGSGSGRMSPHSQLAGSGFMPTGASGVSVGLRDPSSTSGFSNVTYNNNNNNNSNSHPHNALLPSSSSRGSMILYRLSANEDGMSLPPPGVPGLAGRRTSVYSNSGDSIVSMSGDSKYPLVGFGGGGGGGGGGSGTRTPGTPGRPGTPVAANGSSILGNRGGELSSLSEIGKVQGGLVAYVYDPGQDLDADELDEEEEEWVKMVGGYVPRGDLKGFGSFGNAHVRVNASGNGNGGGNGSGKTKMQMHTQSGLGKKGGQDAIRTSNHAPPPTGGIPWRGLVNVSTLIVLIVGLLCLFLLYPVWKAYNNNGVDQLILGNTRINSTGQAVNEVVLDTRAWPLPARFNRDLP